MLKEKLIQVLKSSPECTKLTGDDEAYEEFLDLFPANSLEKLSLENYCLGKPVTNKNTFCQWIERGLEPAFGRYSPGTSTGHLIYVKEDGTIWQQPRLEQRGSPEENISDIGVSHQKIAQAKDFTEAKIILSAEYFEQQGLPSMGPARMLRTLAIYNPEWVIPINSENDIRHFLGALSIDLSIDTPSPVALLETLGRFLSEIQKIVSNVTPYGFMKALYSEELGIAPKHKYKVILTAGAIRNGNISVPKNQTFFPEHYCTKTSEQPEKKFTLIFPDESQVETWCLKNQGRLHKHVGKLFSKENVKVGDLAQITKEKNNDLYRLSFIKKRKPGFDELKAKFLECVAPFDNFPSASFPKTAYWDERGYKSELIDQYNKNIREKLISQASTPEDHVEVFDAFYRLVFTKLPKSGNIQSLWEWRTADFVKYLNVEGKKTEFVSLWRQLISDVGPDFDRISKFNSDLTLLLEGSNYAVSQPAKSRGLPLFLLMLEYPEKHFYLQSTALSDAIAYFLDDYTALGTISEQQLESINKLGRKVFAVLEEWGWKPQDMLDVQSFLWITRITGETEPDEQNDQNEDTKMTTPKPDLNSVFYGPPGTGKTYHTVKKAVDIIDPEFSTTIPNSEIKDTVYKAKYDELVDAKQIRFVTFHQSFSYEDFVEGIRPEQDENSNLTYPVQDGIFKEIVRDAETDFTKGVSSQYNPNTIWKMSLGNTLGDDAYIYDECLENNYILLGYGGDLDFSEAENHNAILNTFRDNDHKLNKKDYDIIAVNYFTNEMQVGDIVIVSDGNNKFRAIAEIVSDYNVSKKLHRSDYVQCREVKWLFTTSESLPRSRIMNKAFSQMTLYKLSKDALNRQKLFAFLQSVEGEAADPANNKPYVLIIDEINRGNISRIFGELITLLEPTKRAGEDDARAVELPYSREKFSVPSNLFILGTMNTADRSLAKLDIALRRRFVFHEMMPEPGLLADKFIEGISLAKLLTAINNRIELLLDRDHTIGHAYLMGFDTFDGLKKAFRYSIVPLLQEYFYDDWQRIHWALNDQVKSSDRLRIIGKNTRNSMQNILPGIEDFHIPENNWHLNWDALENIETYRQMISVETMTSDAQADDTNEALET